MSRILFLLVCLLPCFARAQAPIGAHITGRILFEDGTNRYDRVKIYNRRTGTFITPTSTGFFELYGYKVDTFIFVAQNYTPYNLCYKDSLRQMNYDITVTLHHLEVEMTPVTVTPDKTFDQIQETIDDLGVKNTDTYKNINSFQSPISALYEMFSKKENEKREVAKLENDDMRRRMLRELLKICVKSNLIDLPVSEFDAFIDYCNFTDVYLQHTSLYDLLSNIKAHYKYFKQF